MDSESRFPDSKDVPLTSSVARRIAEKLFQEQPVWRRDALASRIDEIHREGGGVPGQQTPVAALKKALHNLLEDGQVENIAVGLWRRKSSSPPVMGAEQTESVPPSITPDEIEPDDLVTTLEKVVGEGPEVVYLYYSPNDRDLAGFKGLDVWECKIGRTGGEDALPRILGQGVRTAQSHAPVVGLQIRTQDSVALERALHASLRLVEAEVEDSPGTEWFMTSPDRIENWYTTFQQSLSALKRPTQEVQL